MTVEALLTVGEGFDTGSTLVSAEDEMTLLVLSEDFDASVGELLDCEDAFVVEAESGRAVGLVVDCAKE